MSRRALPLILLASGSFALALLLSGVGLPEYSHRVHPVALRGASGLPGAMLFNAGAFLLPGLGLLLASHALRPAVAARGWTARIGLTLAQLSVLAFAMQGVLPLDLRELDGDASRLHALAWMLWWIAFVPAMALLAVGARRGAGFGIGCLLAGMLVPLLAVLMPVGAWVGLAQRLAFVAWFGWWLWAAHALMPQAASGSKAATARR
jgi:hypothetical membrane protein